MPQFSAFVDDAHFTLVLVDFEELHNFNEQIEVEALLALSLWCAHGGHRAQLSDVLLGEDYILLKHLHRPLAQALHHLEVGRLHVQRLSKEGNGSHVTN